MTKYKKPQMIIKMSFFDKINDVAIVDMFRQVFQGRNDKVLSVQR